MPTIDEQLLKLKEYPAKIVFGRATPDGVLVFADDIVCETPDDAVVRIQRYESVNYSKLTYEHEVAPLLSVMAVKKQMRSRLQHQAEVLGYPKTDWSGK